MNVCLWRKAAIPAKAMARLLVLYSHANENALRNQ
jgi:hypothetical protein